jgi:cyclopropane-fatty-acyl-phospholipid synthase
MKTDATWNNHEPAERLSADNLSAYLRGLPAKAKMALRGLIHMHYGRLSIRMPDGRAVLIEGRSEGPEAVLVLHNWNLAHQALTNGTIGVAESYMAGDWESPDVTAFLELFLVNVEVGNSLAGGARGLCA